MCDYVQQGLEKIIVHLILIAVFKCDASISLCASLLFSPLPGEEPEISDREVPCRKKGRPKKKKDTKKKDKEGKPVKPRKRKKIVSLLSCHALEFSFSVTASHRLYCFSDVLFRTAM